MNRTDALKNLQETFKCDGLNRLTGGEVSFLGHSRPYSSISWQPMTFDYANNGNITNKSDAGVFGYDNKK
jgi:hypothetical protein